MRMSTHPFHVGLQHGTHGGVSPQVALSLNVVVAQEAASPEENVKQIALTDAQVGGFIAAQKEIRPILAKAPQRDQPDPKVKEQLEAVAKKYKFANYAEYDDVAENVGLVMSGIDRTPKNTSAQTPLSKKISP